MGIPQVTDRIKEAPAHALRAVFSGFGQLLLAAERLRSQPGGPAREPADGRPAPGTVPPTAPPVPGGTPATAPAPSASAGPAAAPAPAGLAA